MMLKPSIDTLLDKVPSKYSLCILQAKRAHELEAGAKRARQADRKANSAPAKREKKPKPEKAEICSAMMDGLRELGVGDFTINNPEREFIFVHNGTKYKVTLACPRS